MPKPYLLFTAPHDFDEQVWEQYANKYEQNMLYPDAWVCDPSASFIIDDDWLDNLYPSIRVIATPSTGTNHIDLEACKRRGIKVISLLDDREGLNTISASSEFAFKMILDALRIPPARELQGKTVGLVGYGRIGGNLAAWCGMFGAQAWVYDPYKGYKSNLDDMFKRCDVVVICCTLTEETTGMIGKSLLRKLKPGAALVNVARGEIIDEDALASVMAERPDLRVVLDVLVGETTGTQNPDRLKELGAIITPHIAGATFDSRTKAAEIIFKLLEKEFADE